MTRSIAPKRLIGNCVGLGGLAVMDMIDDARQITRRTVLRYVDRDELASIERDLGYGRAWLTMAADWHVGYFRSRYRGRPCVYFVWSAFEYVFA